MKTKDDRSLVYVDDVEQIPDQKYRFVVDTREFVVVCFSIQGGGVKSSLSHDEFWLGEKGPCTIRTRSH